MSLRLRLLGKRDETGRLICRLMLSSAEDVGMEEGEKAGRVIDAALRRRRITDEASVLGLWFDTGHRKTPARLTTNGVGGPETREV